MSVTTAPRTVRATTAPRSAAAVSNRLHTKLFYRMQHYAVEGACMLLGFVLVVWSLTPIYNMWIIALDSHEAIFSGSLWPEAPTLEAFRVVVTQDFWYLERFWHQFGNSFWVGLMVTFLTLSIGSLASFTVGRMRLKNGWILTNAALMTYVIPASFLAIPIYRIMGIYGLTNNLWSVILALTTFATPYAISFSRSTASRSRWSWTKFGARRWRQSIPNLLPDLSAADVAGSRRSRHLRAVAGMERVSVQLPAAVDAAKHDRRGGSGAVPQQRRIAVELYDGDGDHLRDPADHTVLRFPPAHGRWPDDGWREGVTVRVPPVTPRRGPDRRY